MKPTRISFFWMFVILTFAQMLITNYLHLSYYITLSILPTLILFLPIRIGTVGATCSPRGSSASTCWPSFPSPLSAGSC